MFFDHRISLYSPATTREFVDLSRGLADPSGMLPGSREAVWRTLFRDRNMRFLLFHESSMSQLFASLKFQTFANSEEWALLYMDGRTVIAGWLDPDLHSGAGAKDPYEGMRLNLDREAFGPTAVPAPAERPVRPPQGREWYTELWDPTPIPTLDADYAQMCYHYFLGQGKTYNETNRLRRETTLASRLLAVGLQSGDPLLSGLTLPFQASFMAGLSTRSHEPFSRPTATAGQQGGPRPVPGLMEQLAQGLLKNDLSTKDAGPASALYVALRAARRALIHDPDDARLHFLLGHIYLQLGKSTRDGRRDNNPLLLAALRQAQALGELSLAMTLDPQQGPFQSVLALAYLELFPDLHLKHIRQAMRR